MLKRTGHGFNESVSFFAIVRLTIFLGVVAFLSCSKPHVPISASLDQFQGEIDRIREDARSRYSRQIDDDALLFERSSVSVTNQEKLELLKQQITFRTRLIAASLLRYETDLELLLLVKNRKNEILANLKDLRKSKQEIPSSLSAYIKQTEFEDFDEESSRMVLRDQETVPFWKNEMTRWEQSWNSGALDYTPPDHPRDVFLFDYDNQSQAALRFREMFSFDLNSTLRKSILSP